MTKNDRLIRLTQNIGQDDTVMFHPIFMHFAARFHGSTLSDFASDYRTLVDANVHCLEHFDHDAVSLSSDPYRETAAFGAKIEFPEDSVPLCKEKIIKTVDDIKRLKKPDVYKEERTLDRIKGAEYYRESLGDTVPIIGWVEGPLVEACNLAGVNEILLKIAIEPDFVSLLMDKCLVTARDFAKAQVEAGCGVIGVGDAICSQISRDMYRDFVFPRHKELFDYIHSLGALVKLHICGDITHLLPELKLLPVDILDIDWMVDCDHALDVVDGGAIICGNIDPVAVIREASADDVFARSRALVEKVGHRKFILSGGCEITVDSPHDNLLKMRAATATAKGTEG